MAKTYGGRWRGTASPTLGEGGQGHVYPVVDLTGGLEGEFALKRVHNRKRFNRFRAEIEAIKRLDHPNIIKLVDHSSLDENSDDDPFLVMPLAQGGDLSKRDRLSLYKGSVDATLQVAKQIAAGLQVAHQAGIIHRDIKPPNILFVGAGHDLWISDFGICLLQDDEDRKTPDGEVVGPRAFLAPELEEGGAVQVQPAADIYSLGKVIYYMISGGVVVPRERGHEAAYQEIFNDSERLRQLGLLLNQMICPLDRRIKSAGEIIERLNDIEAWEQRARVLPVSPAGLSTIERLQRKAQEATRIESENSDARSQERAILESVTQSFRAWVQAELEMAAAQIAAGGIIRCEVGPVPDNENPPWRPQRTQTSFFLPITGMELKLELPAQTFSFTHHFQVRLCRQRGVGVTVSIGMPGSQIPAPQPVRDEKLAVIFCYSQTHKSQRPNQTRVSGYISRPAAIGTFRGRLVQPAAAPARRAIPHMQNFQVAPITGALHNDVSQYVEFSASEWIGGMGGLKKVFAEALGTFLEFVESDARQIGP